MGQLNSCCGCCSLALGTVCTGICVSISAMYNIMKGVVILLFIEDPIIKYVIGILIIVVASLTLLTSQLLFVAVAKKRREFLRPWLIVYFFTFATTLIEIIIGIANRAVDEYYAIGYFIGVAIMIYMHTVVMSYYQSFDGQSESALEQTSVAYSQCGVIIESNMQPPLVHSRQYSGPQEDVQPLQAPP